MAEADKIGLTLGSEPPSKDVLTLAARQVGTLRAQSSDPLNLTLQVISGAAQSATAKGRTTLLERDVVGALPPMFHLPDRTLICARVDAVDSFVREAPLSMKRIDDSAVELLYQKTKDVCVFDAKGSMRNRVAGFGAYQGCGEVNLSGSGTFFDMRYVIKAIEDLGGASIQRSVPENLDVDPNELRRIELRGDPKRGQIEVFPLAG